VTWAPDFRLWDGLSANTFNLNSDCPGDKGDSCARNLFNLPAMVSDRGSRDSSVDERESMELENTKLKSSLEHEQARNAKLKVSTPWSEELLD
jgi:hypothetical protein